MKKINGKNLAYFLDNETVPKPKIEKPKQILVALAGNPNCGKTSLFNKLVGANQRVGNWAGVTVERFEGSTFHRDYLIKIIDLPGTYSLTTYSPEEIVARNFIVEEKPDVVINVVDSTNLERNFFLTTQLIDIQANLIVALNMMDEVEDKKAQIDIGHLENLLGIHTIPTSAVKGTGIEELLDHVVDLYTNKIVTKHNKLVFSDLSEHFIERISEILKTDEELSAKYVPRWLAIKLLVNDKDIYGLIHGRPIWIKIHQILEEAIRRVKIEQNTDPEMLLKEERHSFIRGAIRETVKFKPKTKRTTTEIIDSLLINRITGLPIFALFMWLIFQVTFRLGEMPMNLIENLFTALSNFIVQIIPEGIGRSILVDGVIAGVGGVLVFLPNIMILFLSLSFLEGTGYMARAAFVIDKVMHKFGLHGKSFIPMITGFGCSVPAFMATRTLKSESDRITTLLVIPFMSCGAKFPVYVLVAGTFFDQNSAGNVLFGIYLLGVVIALISARLMKSILFKDISEPFVMELPPYRMPTFKTLMFQMWFRASQYLRKAGTIILFVSVLIWVASNFPKSESVEKLYITKIENVKQNVNLSDEQKLQKITKLESKKNSLQLENSAVGIAGKFIEPIVRPLGFDWKLGLSIVTGIAAKEIIVSTMGTLYSLGSDSGNTDALREKLLASDKYNKAVAISFLVFILLYIPCFAASIVFHREAGSWKWTAFYAVYTMSVAWLISFVAYNIAGLFLL